MLSEILHNCLYNQRKREKSGKICVNLWLFCDFSYNIYVLFQTDWDKILVRLDLNQH